MKRFVLALAVLLALPSLAQDAVQLRAEIRTEKVVVGGETTWDIRAIIYRIDGPVAVPVRVDADGNPIERQWYVGLDKVQAECPEAGCVTETEWNKARDTAIEADLQPRLARFAVEIEVADNPPPLPPGLDLVGGSTHPGIPLDREYAAKRAIVVALRTEFVAALGATVPDPDNDGQTVAAPRCRQAQGIYDDAIAMLGSAHDEVRRARSDYARACRQTVARERRVP